MYKTRQRFIYRPYMKSRPCSQTIPTTQVLHENDTDECDNVTSYVIHHSYSLLGGVDLYWAENVLRLSHPHWYVFVERFV